MFIIISLTGLLTKQDLDPYVLENDTNFVVWHICKRWLFFCLFFFLCLYAVNQHLFLATLFHDLLPINWFATTNVCDQALSRPIFCYNNHTTKTGLRREIFCDDEALAYPSKISRTRIKVVIVIDHSISSTCVLLIVFPWEV